MANDKIDVVVGKKAFDEVGKLKIELEGLIKTFNELYSLTKQSGGNPFGLPKQGTAKAAKQGLTEIEKSARKLDKTNKALSANEAKASKARESQIKKESDLRERLRTQRNKEEKDNLRNLQKAAQATKKLAKEKADEVRKTQKAAEMSAKLGREYNKLTAKMNASSKVVQDLNAKKLQGKRLSDVEQKELKQSTRDFLRYQKAVLGADASVGRFQRNVGNYPRAMGSAATAVKSLSSAMGLMGGAFLFVQVMREAFNTVLEFDRQLIAVEKTTNMTDSEINLFKEDVVSLGVELKGISIQGLLKASEVAGQLGIKGRDNILKFSKVVQQLGLTSDIIGDESVRNFAKFIEVSTDTVENADRLGSVITQLGNNFATTENQILKNSTEIQKALAIYDATAQGVLGLGAATSALGAEAEQSRSALQSTFKVLNDGAATGKNLDRILKITGQSAAEFREQFGRDSVATFQTFIKGLARTADEGENLSITLRDLNLDEKRTEAVIGVLSKNYDVLADSLSQASTEYETNTALKLEADKAAKSLSSIIGDLGDSFDGLVLSIDKGDGAFSRFLKSALEKSTNLLDFFAGGNEKKLLDSRFKSGQELGKKFTEGYQKEVTERVDKISPNGSESFKKNFVKERVTLEVEAKRLRATKSFNVELSKQLNLQTKIEETKKRRDGFQDQADSSSIGTVDNFMAITSAASATFELNGYNKELEKVNKEVAFYNGLVSQIAEFQLKDIEVDLKSPTNPNGDGVVKTEEEIAAEEKIRQQGLKDTFELRKYLIEQQIELSDNIFEDEKRNDDDRLTQLSYRYAKEQELAKLNYDNEINEKGISTAKKSLIDAKYEDEKATLEASFLNDRIQLLKLEELTIEELIKNREGVLETSFNNELESLNQLLLDKEISQKEHEERLFQLKKDYALRTLEMEILNLEKLLSNEDLTVSEQIELEKKLAAIRAKFSNKKVDNAKEASEDIRYVNSEEFKKIRAFVQELGNLGSALYDARIQRVDDEIQRNNDKYANILDNENLTEQQRDAIEAERDAKNAQLEKKKREEQRKQAIFNKAMAVVEIGVQTAVNIVKAGANPILIALAAAIGAAQLAVVAATPIPRFKDGKRKGQGKDGMALVNDGGRDEIKLSADGTMTRYSGRNVLDYVKSSDTIIPNADNYMRDLNRASVMASLQNNGQNLSNSIDRVNFDTAMYNMESKMESGIKKGFKGVRMNIVNNIKTGSKDAYIASKMM